MSLNDSSNFANPSAPVGQIEEEKVSSKKLTNDDFRLILNTPRAGRDDTSKANQTPMNPPKKTDANKKKHQRHIKPHKKPEIRNDKDMPSVRGTPTPYRDRARERREGKIPELGLETPLDVLTGGQYKAMSGRPTDNAVQAENRQQLINDSKYLGGDISHTHLVKGLDYVLLGKARRDIEAKENEIYGKDKHKNDSKQPIELNASTHLAKKILQALFEKRTISRNANFRPGRMAYRIDLDDYGEFDVPTTIQRSAIDCERLDDNSGVISTNQRVINNLTNILSYLRVERKQAKKAKQKEKGIEERETKDDRNKEFDMFGDLSESKDKKSRDRKPQSDKYHTADKKHSSKNHKDSKNSSKYFESKPAITTEEPVAPQNSLEKMKMHVKILEKKHSTDEKTYQDHLIKYLNKKAAATGYDECYPELNASFDAMGDSDDEADYTKMDMGNKKGPVGRWDFENPDDYSKYMSNKEALPKAAFQYGVKMADGRKTRRINGPKDSKAQIERDWKKIQENLAKTGGNASILNDSYAPPNKKFRM